MVKRTRFSKLSLAFMFLIIIPLGYGGYLLLHDLEAPEVFLSHRSDRVSPTLPIVLTAKDALSGVKDIAVQARYNEEVFPVFEKSFTERAVSQQVVFSLENAGLPDGAVFDLEIRVRDASYGGFGFGNRKTLILPMRMDAIPPRMSLKSSVPTVRRGGTGCVVYAVSKEVQQTGVKIGDLFFPGFRQDNGDFICFFGFPYDMDIKNYSPQLFALDLAGNAQSHEFAINRVHRQFKSDTIVISQGFLDSKSAEFAAMAPGNMSDIERFLKVNGPVRRANAAALLKIGKDTADRMLWQGAFLRLPRAASRAGFADHRVYIWDNQKVDEQTHLGFDLASLKQADIPAANSGRVVFADYMGIYGNLIIIDHGLGLQSLYSHLSEIGVLVGQEVEKGRIIGKTGATGMAGGDHLHFGILVSGLEVTPLEWLDSHWIKDNVVDRINAAGSKAPSFAVEAPETPEAKPPTKKPARNARRLKR